MWVGSAPNDRLRAGTLRWPGSASTTPGQGRATPRLWTSVRPRPGSARRRAPTDLWVAYADRAGSGNDRILHGSCSDDGHGNSGPRARRGPGAAPVAAGSTARQPLRFSAVDRRPVTAGLGSGSAGAGGLARERRIATPPLPRRCLDAPSVLMTAAADRTRGDRRRSRRARVPGRGRRSRRPSGTTLHDLVSSRAAGRPPGGDRRRPERPGRLRHRWSWLGATAGSWTATCGSIRSTAAAGAVGPTLRFLRHDRPQDPSYTGAFDDPANRGAMRSTPPTRPPRPEMRLIIGAASYSGHRRDSGPATGGQLGSGPRQRRPPRYRPARRLLADSTVDRPSDIRTLAKILTTHGRTIPGSRFGLGTEPGRPEARVRSRGLGRFGVGPPGRRPGHGAARPRVGRRPAARSQPPDLDVSLLQRGYQNPELSWEYFDGRLAAPDDGFLDGTDNLSSQRGHPVRRSRRPDNHRDRGRGRLLDPGPPRRRATTGDPTTWSAAKRPPPASRSRR